MSTDRSITPLEELEHLLRSWPLLILLTLWGGAVGWFLHENRSPIYEARATFYISIDFTRTGELTQFEEDHAVSVASAVLQGGPVLDRVAAAAQAEGLPYTPTDLLEKGFLERQQATWTLRLRDPDPETAARLANLWAENGLAVLTAAHRAALEAQALQSLLDGLSACLDPERSEAVGRVCGERPAAELSEEIQRLSEEVSAARAESQGLLPALVFDLTRPARTPRQPVQFGRNSMVLAGALIGLLGSAWAVAVRLPAWLTGRLRRGR